MFVSDGALKVGEGLVHPKLNFDDTEMAFMGEVITEAMASAEFTLEVCMGQSLREEKWRLPQLDGRDGIRQEDWLCCVR